MWTALANFWSSLPHPVQAAVVLFGGDLGGAIYAGISSPNACWTAACLGAYALTGLKTGIVAVLGLYIPSSLYQKTS